MLDSLVMTSRFVQCLVPRTVDSPKEESVQTGIRHHRQQLLDQTEVRFAESDVDLTVHESSALILSSFGHFGVAMTQICNSDTTGEIKVRLVIVPTGDR